MKEDKGLSAVQEFLRAKARKWTALWCSVCKMEPPKHPGGPCADCERELGTG